MTTSAGIELSDVELLKLTHDAPFVYRVIAMATPPGKRAFHDFTPSKFLLANPEALEAYAKDCLCRWVRRQLP
jgi:hypothetical protein